MASTADNATPVSGTIHAGARAGARDSAVAVESLTHAYGARTALDGVTFRAAPGEILAVLGPNGSGKTTLFRVLSTLVPPQAGAVRVLGDDIVRDRHRVRAHIGVVFQAPALDRKLTVRENLRHHGHLYGLAGKPLAQRIDTGLERFRLADRRDALVETLSGGLRRRVELAKALLPAPRVLVLDEPSTGLDPGARLDLWQALDDVRREDGVTVLLTSHILEEVERSDRVAILAAGRLVAFGSPRELAARVGGDVLSIVSREPEQLAGAIVRRLDVEARVVDGIVRVEHGVTLDLARTVLETFAADVVSVTLARPSLEDVFIQCTGHGFRDGKPEDKAS